jgi:hypothetical protein
MHWDLITLTSMVENGWLYTGLEIDPEAQFLFVPPDKILEVAERGGAIPYDARWVELGHPETNALRRYHGQIQTARSLPYFCMS